MGLKKENQGAMTKCTIISSQLLFLLGYFINGLSNKCIYWFCLKTSKPRFARELHLIPWLRQDLGMIQQERQNNIINILG
ncbi:hypothetical protein, partial [Dialister hominis]|uniref:hypothetical protein n=1 Tax=Dialister hominis TaxID=2582419 RepID=UPI003FEE6AD5